MFLQMFDYHPLSKKVMLLAETGMLLALTRVAGFATEGEDRAVLGAWQV